MNRLCSSLVSRRKKKTMKLSRALSDLVKYTKSVGVHDIEAQGEGVGGASLTLSAVRD